MLWSSCLGFPGEAHSQASLLLWGRAQDHGPQSVQNKAARILGSGIPLVSHSLCSYKVLPSSLSMQRVTASNMVKPREGIGVKHQCDACWLSRQRGNIPPWGTAHGWENVSPETTSSWAEPWLSPAAYFHQDVSRLQQGLKNEFLQVACQPSHTQVYKEEQLMFLLCLCFLSKGYVNIACLYYPIWKDISFYQFLLHNLNNWNLFKGSLLQENALHLGF